MAAEGVTRFASEVARLARDHVAQRNVSIAGAMADQVALGKVLDRDGDCGGTSGHAGEYHRLTTESSARL